MVLGKYHDHLPYKKTSLQLRLRVMTLIICKQNLPSKAYLNLEKPTLILKDFRHLIKVSIVCDQNFPSKAYLSLEE